METIGFLLILKILLTGYVAILVPVYWKNYGPQNFLWLSDIGLFLTLLALWFKSPLLISMASIGIFPVEIIWIIDFFVRLSIKRRLLGITDYMFESDKKPFLKSLSLFHVFVPVLMIGLLYKWGYDSDAFFCQVVLTWIVFILTYFLTDPKDNINWIYLPNVQHWKNITSLIWLVFLLFGFPIFIICPFHELFRYLFQP